MGNIEKEEPNQFTKQEGGRISKMVYFTGMGFRMIAIIGLFTFVGYKIDEKRTGEVPLFTAGLSLVGVIIALYIVIRQVVSK